MTIEGDLKLLITPYIKDNVSEKYDANFDNEKLQNLSKDFKKILYKWLLQKGAQKRLIKEQYEQLQSYFKDKSAMTSEVIWLEEHLSQGLNNGVCFRILDECCQKFTAPENFKELTFSNITSREDLFAWLEKLKNNSRTVTEEALYTNLINLAHESGNFYNEIGKINFKGIKVLLGFIPIILIGLGTFVFAEELLAIYALYFVLLKGGQSIGKSEQRHLHAMGNTLQKISIITATTTTSMLAGLAEMIFFGSSQCYLTTVQVGSALLEPFNSPTPEQQSTVEDDFLLASKNTDKGKKFNHLELKIIATPIEARIMQLSKQRLLTWRTGEAKLTFLRKFLTDLSEIDENCDTLKIKYNSIQNLLDKIRRNKKVYVEGKRTTAAIDQSQAFLLFLKENLLISQEGTPQEIKEDNVDAAESQRLILTCQPLN